MKPHFVPGARGKAYYSDTNFQLLGKIIETITNLSLSQALQTYLFAPLHLKHTYLFDDPRDNRPALLYYKDTPLHIPEAMTSFWADGSLVATAQDNSTFLRAFFGGSIFPDKYLTELYIWNKIFFPFQYGVGIARFKLPFVFSPIKPMPELIGHPASTGAFAYFCPEKNLFLTGTVNQINNPGIPYKMIIKILNTID